MGGSSKLKNTFETIWADESTNYFVTTIENWRDEVQKENYFGQELKNFYLFGHGFSANIAAWYAMQYP